MDWYVISNVTICVNVETKTTIVQQHKIRKGIYWKPGLNKQDESENFMLSQRGIKP